MLKDPAAAALEHTADNTMVLGKDDSEFNPPTLPEAVRPISVQSASDNKGSCVLDSGCGGVISVNETQTSIVQSSNLKRKRGRFQKHKADVIPPSPVLPVSLAEPPSSSLPSMPEIEPPSSSLFTPPSKIPKKRGRKSKAELLSIRLSQGLEASVPKEQSAAGDSDTGSKEQEVTPSGRPRRRAAKTALLYLQDLEDEWSASGVPSPSKPTSTEEGDYEEPVKRRRKRKKAEEVDEDFVVSEDVLQAAENEEAESERLSDISDSELESIKTKSTATHCQKESPTLRGFAENGFYCSIMAPIWKATEVTMEYHDLNHSYWEFPEWIPNKENWHILSASDYETYIPSQATSPQFAIRREGIKEDSDIYTLGRFQSLPPHPERWDMTFFVGGPVWAMEWCPTMSGSRSCQYLALYCHKGMDDQTRVDITKTGPALLQLWNLGPLDMERGAESAATFSYGLALDHGCIWDLKFCPSGGWELPSIPRKNSQMARLGLLAAAFSSGFIEIYSLPHPESLYTHRKEQVKGYQSDELTICKVDCVVRLQVGSIKCRNLGENGQCFTLAWVPSKPHNHLAAGFYDGTVSIWDLKTKSALQKVRQGRVIKQYPFNSFQAHDHAVRSVEWCKANSNFLVTAGSDRHLKFWDLRRLYEPINNIKRFLSTEIAWLLPYCGVAVAQENCYASHGLCGIHFVDSGFQGYKPYFLTPRKGTVWSISGSDWLGSVSAGDVTGEMIVILLPNLNVHSLNIKRPADRRFPVYKADFLPLTPSSSDTSPAVPELPVGPLVESSDWGHFKPKSFRAAEGHYSFLFQDTDLRKFHNFTKRDPMKRMHANETKGDLNTERVQLEAIHKVRFCPNLDAHTWISSGGHSGLIRLHCVKGLFSSVAEKFIQEKSAQFQAKFEEADTVREFDYSPEVQHCIVQI